MKNKYDLAVIGAGPGGYVAAIRAAQLGFKTVCIDKRVELGGTCLNVGCIPSKALLQSTELLARVKNEGKELGVDVKEVAFDFAAMMNHKAHVVKGLVKGIEGSFKTHNVDYIQGTAKFIDSHTLQVEKQEIEAKFILIATGSEPIELQNLKFDEKQIISSTGALSLKSVPKNLAVIGGGAIGLELASVYNRLGTDVTIIEMLNCLCPAMDSSISQQLFLALKKQGIKFKLSSQVVTALQQPNEVILTINSENNLENFSTESVLVAIGRKPYSKNMDLEKVNINVNQKGFIEVNKAFQTNYEHIFAIGDIIEGPMLAHRASEEGLAVIEMIAKNKIIPLDYMTIPNVIYTHPEAASIGLTEEEAKVANLKIVVGKSQFRANPRARCSAETEGLVKVIGDYKSGKIIGLHILGSHASELIEEGMIAIKKRATLQDLAYSPHAHPTLSESIKEAALAALEK